MAININKSGKAGKYYFKKSGIEYGPFQFEWILPLIDGDTLVKLSNSKWSPAKQLQEFEKYFEISDYQSSQSNQTASPIVDLERSKKRGSPGLIVFMAIISVILYFGFNYFNSQIQSHKLDQELLIQQQKYLIDSIALTNANQKTMLLNQQDSLNKIKINNQIDSLRINAEKAGAANDLLTAVNDLVLIVNSGKANAIDYNDLGWYLILSKQYLKAISYLKEGDKINNAELFIKGNLAHALLLNGDFSEAKEIYIKFKGQNVSKDKNWEQMIRSDFETFNYVGINSEKFNEILLLLNLEPIQSK